MQTVLVMMGRLRPIPSMVASPPTKDNLINPLLSSYSLAIFMLKYIAFNELYRSAWSPKCRLSICSPYWNWLELLETQKGPLFSTSLLVSEWTKSHISLFSSNFSLTVHNSDTKELINLNHRTAQVSDSIDAFSHYASMDMMMNATSLSYYLMDIYKSMVNFI